MKQGRRYERALPYLLAAPTVAVLFALYGIFDTSVRAFGYGGDRIEAVGDARLALSRMEREIRGAYPYDLTSDPPKRYLLLDPSIQRRPRYRPRPASPSATRQRETAGSAPPRS